MKQKITTLFILLFVTSTFYSNAQLQKGSILVSGQSSFDLSFGSSKIKSDDATGDPTKTTNFELAPQAGYFVMDNLAVGLALNVSSEVEKDPDNDKSTNTAFVVGPFARYYYPIGNLSPFAQFGAFTGSLKNKFNPDGADNTTEIKYGLVTFQLAGGVGVFIGERASLDLGVNFTSNRRKANENNDNNTRTLSSDFGLFAGFSIFF